MSEIDDEMDFCTFSDAIRLGLQPAAIVAHFGVRRAAELRLRYDAEMAIRKIDLRAPLAMDNPCSECGRKHCGGHAYDRMTGR